MDPARMQHLVTLPTPFEGKILAARLGAEGVVCELRGGVDGPYPTGPVHVYVEARNLALAQEVLELPSVDDQRHAPDGSHDDLPPHRASVVAVLVVLGVSALLLASVARLLLFR